jgi:3-methylcrotonyl-CoA carboxylase alpha subunit
MPGFFLIDGKAYQVALIRSGPGYVLSDGSAAAISEEVTLAMKDGSVWMHRNGRTAEFLFQDAVTHYAEEAGPSAGNLVRAPMPGSVVALHAAPGDDVALNDPLMVITSMKMEILIRAPRAGRVETVHVAEGGGFDRDAILVTLAAAP